MEPGEQLQVQTAQLRAVLASKDSAREHFVTCMESRKVVKEGFLKQQAIKLKQYTNPPKEYRWTGEELM